MLPYFMNYNYFLYDKLLYSNKLSVLFIILLLSSCTGHDDYPGYSESGTGLYYKLQSIGDGKRKPGFGDFLQLTITYKTQKDSVFMDTYSSNDMGTVILPFNHSSFRGSFEEGLLNMNEGDSVSFIVSGDSLFEKFFHSPLPYFLKPGEAVKMDVKLTAIMNQSEYAALEQKYQQMIEDRDIEEQRKLRIFLDTSNVNYNLLNTGIYYLPERTGNGDFPEAGNLVKLNYTGRFLNGRLFESTYQNGQPFEFTFGEQGQVLKGLESAISLLNQGAKAKFIIPSQLAFGEKGSSNGTVPPYSTVVYEIELLKITK